jgi:hypothetical protein
VRNASNRCQAPITARTLSMIPSSSGPAAYEAIAMAWSPCARNARQSPSRRYGPQKSARRAPVKIARTTNQPEYRAGRLRLARNYFARGDAMPEEHRSFIERECLRVARSQPGCGHLRAIAIARTDAPNRKPNCCVMPRHGQSIDRTELITQGTYSPFVGPSFGCDWMRLSAGTSGRRFCSTVPS